MTAVLPSAPPVPPLDLSAAAAAPRRRRRRAGDERHRHRARRDGPPRVGQRPPRAAVARPGAGRGRGRRTSATTAASSTGCDAVTSRPRSRRTNIELRAAAAARHPRRCAGPGCWRRSAPRPASVAVAGTHGKTTTTSMLMLILAEAGLAPSFIVGGDVTDVGTGAQWTGGEWLVVEADESDGTHLELPLARHDPAPTSRSTTSTTTARSRRIVDGFDRYLGQIAGPKVLVRRRPGLPPSWPRATAPSRTASADDADVRAVDVAPTGGSFRFAVERRRRRRQRLGEVDLPLRGVHNVRQRHRRRSPWRWRSACRSTTASARSPASAASPGASTSAASTAAPRSSTTTPTCRPRSPPSRRRPRQRRRLAARRRRVPAEPLQPDRRAVAASTPTPSSTPTSSCSPTSTRRARRRSRA